MALSFEHLHRNLFYLISLLPLLALSLLHPVTANPSAKSYIVYMGRSTKEQGDIEDAKLSHLTLLSSVIPSEAKERLFLKHIYHHSFKGFSAMLTEDEASLLSESDEILSIFPDTELDLHTTRSWDFLESSSGMARIQRLYPNGSNDVIIGVIDSGIWPESPSFGDDGFSEIPSRWKGTCMEGSDFKKSDCNRKLIGARYYDLTESSSNDTSTSKPIGSPRDETGHGTHVTSIAVGNLVPNANDQGLARGLAKGGFTSSRFAVYKVCNSVSCSASASLKAIDDAIQDGVDIISISLGLSIQNSTFLDDPIALGSLHAVQAGILVIAAAGNSGPTPSWIQECNCNNPSICRYTKV
ncbi:CO(2)-response secreted protease-like [Papaver somniferum]|uniref:CO(2)-response secreted protease-like n=1 Tax=Papaver somniferum TaxID=3469 RepID=UPI000E700C78|nr:CO(2)-response secreted protease-like [Papaver somniferum]